MMRAEKVSDFSIVKLHALTWLETIWRPGAASWVKCEKVARCPSEQPGCQHALHATCSSSICQNAAKCRLDGISKAQPPRQSSLCASWARNRGAKYCAALCFPWLPDCGHPCSRAAWLQAGLLDRLGSYGLLQTGCGRIHHPWTQENCSTTAFDYL